MIKEGDRKQLILSAALQDATLPVLELTRRIQERERRGRTEAFGRSDAIRICVRRS